MRVLPVEQADGHAVEGVGQRGESVGCRRTYGAVESNALDAVGQQAVDEVGAVHHVEDSQFARPKRVAVYGREVGIVARVAFQDLLATFVSNEKGHGGVPRDVYRSAVAEVRPHVAQGAPRKEIVSERIDYVGY